jgi:hypothetical protein
MSNTKIFPLCFLRDFVIHFGSEECRVNLARKGFENFQNERDLKFFKMMKICQIT